MTPLVRALSCGLAAALAPGLARAPRLALGVEEGRELVKTLESETVLTLDSLLQRFGGSVVSDEAPPMEAWIARRTVVRDTYGPVDGGGPAHLSRLFDEHSLVIDGSARIQGTSPEFLAELESDLVGLGVVFRRDEDGEYEVSFDDESGGSEDLLERHDVDMDLLGLLPEADVEEGDTWEVEGEALRSVLATGGAPPMTLLSVDGEWEYLRPSDVLALAVGNLARTALEEIDGEATVHWARTEEDGRVAVLEFELEAETEAALGTELQELVDDTDAPDEREELVLDATWTVEGEGLVEWDLVAGHMRSLTLDTEVEVAVEMTWVQPFGDNELDFVGEYVLVGTSELGVSVAADR